MKKLGTIFIGVLFFALLLLWDWAYLMEAFDPQKIDYSTLLTNPEKFSFESVLLCDGALNIPEGILVATEKIIRLRHVSKDAEKRLTPDAIARLLHNVGAQLDSHNRRKYTVLHLAAESGNVEVLKVLLAAQVDVDEVGLRGCTALHFAVAKGHVKCAELLIKSRARIHIGDGLGFTPLHTAVNRNQPACVKLLLNYGAVVNAIDKFGGTALDAAVRNGHKECIEVLLEFYNTHGIEVPVEVKAALKKMNIQCCVQ